MQRSLRTQLRATVLRVGGWKYVVAFAGALAVALMAWERWFHGAVLGLSDLSGAGNSELIRDSLVLLVLAIAAVLTGYGVAHRLRGHNGGVLTIWRALGVSTALGVLVAGAIAVSDGLLGTQITPAPGAGYLLPDSGFVAAISHGLRDGLVAQLILIPVALLGVMLLKGQNALPAVAAPATRSSAALAPAATGAPGTDGQAQPSLYSRREALQYGTAGTFAVALGSGGLVTMTADAAHAATPAEVTPWLTKGISLFINEGTQQMIDGTPVYMWGWGFESEGVSDRNGLNTPGPVIWTHEGETVDLTITNTLNEDHNFFIEDVVDTGVIAPGETVSVSFPAPSAGTYLYQDALNGPVNRLLGLHGVLLVMPADRSMRSNADLAAEHWTFDTQWVWLFNDIDPAVNARAQADLPIDGSTLAETFTPRYFTINGRMGSLAAHIETAPDTVIEDKVDHPALIRIVNAGLATHAPHIHGNHVYVLSKQTQIEEPIMWRDMIMVEPEDRKDCYLPFNVPPNAVYWPPHPDGAAFLKELHGTDMEGKFPMHCHAEQSQTAGGGLYPQGLVTDWKIK